MRTRYIDTHTLLDPDFLTICHMPIFFLLVSRGDIVALVGVHGILKSTGVGRCIIVNEVMVSTSALASIRVKCNAHLHLHL
jgi:hypothetical protein